MATMEQFDTWARRAAREEAPLPDVTGPVLARLRRAEESEAEDLGWLWGAAAATACVAVVSAALGYMAWSDVTAHAPWLGLARDFHLGWML